MSQSKKLSLIEAVSNTAIGYIINLVLNHFILKSLGCNISIAENIFMSTLFTLVSIVRSYLMRRAFNRVKQ